jgi:hypothetical protein
VASSRAWPLTPAARHGTAQWTGRAPWVGDPACRSQRARERTRTGRGSCRGTTSSRAPREICRCRCRCAPTGARPTAARPAAELARSASKSSAWRGAGPRPCPAVVVPCPCRANERARIHPSPHHHPTRRTGTVSVGPSPRRVARARARPRLRPSIRDRRPAGRSSSQGGRANC